MASMSPHQTSQNKILMNVYSNVRSVRENSSILEVYPKITTVNKERLTREESNYGKQGSVQG